MDQNKTNEDANNLLKDQKPKIPIKKYEYLDHTADVQLHSWGETLIESFEQIAISMFAYMTDIESVEMTETHELEVKLDSGDIDDINLVFHWLDEWLFVFSAERFFIPRKIVIKEFDMDKGYIKAIGYGEPFLLGKHPQGTEVKAITYSNLQVHKEKPTNDIYVIIDI
jgi:SHS2 domain-containing protein